MAAYTIRGWFNEEGPGDHSRYRGDSWKLRRVLEQRLDRVTLTNAAVNMPLKSLHALCKKVRFDGAPRSPRRDS